MSREASVFKSTDTDRNYGGKKVKAIKTQDYKDMHTQKQVTQIVELHFNMTSVACENYSTGFWFSA